MSDFYLDQERIADGCVIYRNPPKPGSKSKLWWYVRIRLQQEKRYIRKSLRTTDYDEAKRAAYKLYEDVRRDEYYGYKPDAVNLSQIMELYLQEVQLVEQILLHIKKTLLGIVLVVIVQMDMILRL